jgi:hypothetical protein
MELQRTLRRITAYVVGSSVLLAAAAFLFGGTTMGLGAIVGAGLGTANWLAMRWVGGKLVVANDRGRLVWGGLLGFKMLAMLVIAWGVLATGVVDPAGFTIGLSGLVLGILAGGFHTAFAGDLTAGEAASEES